MTGVSRTPDSTRPQTVSQYHDLETRCHATSPSCRLQDNRSPVAISRIVEARKSERSLPMSL